MYRTLFFVQLLSLILLSGSNGQRCLRTNEVDGRLPFLRDYSSGTPRTGVIQHWRQAIIPSYRFNCHGNITEWGVNIAISNNNSDDEMFTLDFQVWRPSSLVASNGCYRLVGNNRFTSVRASNGIARLVPQRRNRVRFRPGDVLGFYAESSIRNQGRSRGVMTLRDFEEVGDRRFEREEVWYGSIEGLSSGGNSDCPFPTGIDRILNNVVYEAPVISISMEYLNPSTTPLSSTANIQPSGIVTTITTSSENVQPTIGEVLPSNLGTNASSSTAGIVLGAIFAVAFTAVFIVVVVIMAIKIRVDRKKNASAKQELRRGTASMIGNSAYNGTVFHNLAVTSSQRDTHIYDYPQPSASQLQTIPTDITRVKNVSIEEDTRPTTLYVMNIPSHKNEAYGIPVQGEESLEESYVRYY